MNAISPPYLGVSIFYNKSQWHELITNCLALFFRQHANVFDEYVLSFANDQGEHLRLVIKSKAPKKLREQLDKTLKLYLKNNPSDTVPQEFKDDLLFINFPNNNHYFDLFKTGNERQNNPGEILKNKLQVLITKNIVSQLAKTTIDRENILTFGIYMQSGLIKALYGKNQSVLNDLKEISNNLLKTLAINYQVNIDLQYILIRGENGEELNNLINELWDIDLKSTEFKWIKDFSKKVSNILPGTENARAIAVSSFAALFKQIDLPDNKLLALSSLLNYGLLLQKALLTS